MMLDSNDKVRVLSVQTQEMKRAYLGVKPDVVLIDTTFNFETSGYKMSAICYLNPVTNRGEIPSALRAGIYTWLTGQPPESPTPAASSGNMSKVSGV